MHGQNHFKFITSLLLVVLFDYTTLLIKVREADGTDGWYPLPQLCVLTARELASELCG